MYVTKIKSDKYKPFADKQEKAYQDMGMEWNKDQCVPVDLYGKRVNLDQNDATNLGKTADDIQDVYGLTPGNDNSTGLAKEEEGVDDGD